LRLRLQRSRPRFAEAKHGSVGWSDYFVSRWER